MHYILPTGCTQAHTFTLPVPGERIEKIYISYEQGNRVLVEKDISDCVFDVDTEDEEEKYLVTVFLTQEDTLKFKESAPSGRRIKIQIRIRLYNGDVQKSKIIIAFADELVKKGEI